MLPWEKLRSSARGLWPGAVAVGVVAVLGTAAYFLEPDTRDDWQRLRDAAALFAGGLLAWVAMRRVRAQERQVETAEAGLTTERFTKAIGQLGEAATAVRLGGIYALEKIAQDAPERYHRTVMEVLCAYVRDHVRPAADATAPDATAPPCPTDIQAALDVLQRRQRSPAGKVRMSLNGADLRGANLEEAHLEGADLFRARFERAYLWGAHLEGAQCGEASFAGAYLGEARLAGTFLDHAHLEGARYLTQAQLDTANGDSKTTLPANLDRPAHWNE